ncbi:hypothetical protein [Paenibacillus alkalitolerans]|uniref:hypothetical protein n=1 Tax=Paenibacillus alkalitolerans TaxID=2799335 RepID=UPI0018F7A8F8|nr:hypothetical protein [Paenibacillus alkalitolerans]
MAYGKGKCEVIGPQGVKSSQPSTTTKKGSEPGRTQGAKQTYKQTGKMGGGGK